ncbi:hypothetical protein FFLO_00640 [Filobasidium floriforme]|uniref:Dolichol-phosphate mannosyltransferase subunit 3 n=1 Tax=Filobasidium floriforme TaxID=5210 RepID=A0A8K0JSX0_9TREE|nr:hypothetical protein FFLO_00640 [Filobasidium floriforme]
MTRATRFAAYLAPLIIYYLLALLGIVNIPFMSQESSDALVPVLPFWVLVTFGAYSLGSLGLGLVRFRDCPEAYRSLMLEISQAKDDLRSKGVTVD